MEGVASHSLASSSGTLAQMIAAAQKGDVKGLTDLSSTFLEEAAALKKRMFNIENFIFVFFSISKK
mgnify:CR=1 FL=1